MKIKLQKENLVSGLQKVQNVITTKSNLLILSYILINSENNKIKLTATDLDIGISCLIPVETLETGSICVPAKRFFEIIRELPQEEIEIITRKNNLVTIKTKSCEFKIIGLDAEEFPKLPEFKESQTIKLEAEVLQKAIKLTSFAVSLDETRYILNGVLFYFRKDSLTVVATDGRRLAVKEEKISYNINKEIKVIVPIKAVKELERNLSNTNEITIVLSKNQIGFEFDEIIIVSRLIEGDFPDYQQVIPAPAHHSLKVERQLLLGAIRRAALLSTLDYQAVKLELSKNRLVISKTTPDIGESYEELPVEYEGREIIIGFNPDYLTDVLKNLEDDIIELELTESEKPGVIRKSGYIYIVLPMRLG